MHHPKAMTGVALALVCACLVAVLPVISNGRPQGFDALGFAFFLSFYQFVFSLPLFVKELAQGSPLFAPGASHDGKRTLALTLLTGILFCIAIFLFVFGVEKAGTVNGAIAVQASPLFALLIEIIVLRARKSAVELALTGILLAALYALATNDTWAMSGLNIWFLAALAVPLLWSIAHIIIRQELGKSPLTPAQITCFRVGLSALFLGIAWQVIAPGALWQALLNPQWQLIAALMGLVYYLELVIWFHAIRHIPVSLASSTVATSPALTMVFAALVLHETVQPYQVAAFAVLVFAIIGLALKGARPKPAIHPSLSA